MRRPLALALLASTAGAAFPALAADLSLSLALPQISVAEYHRPYVAVFVEGPDQAAAATLAVWYETDRQDHGQRYLKELRQWWRKAGRGMSLPVDGVSGATRAPGPHALTVPIGAGPLAALPPGQYTLVIEAAREVGGREVVRLPLTLPAKAGQTGRTQGAEELGAVSFRVK